MRDYGSKGVRGREDRSDTDLRRAAKLIEQLKAALATEIIRALAREELSVRDAQAATGVTAADFSRIRNADLGRFTIDRLVSILSKLGSQVELAVRTTRQRHRCPEASRATLRPRSTASSSRQGHSE